MIRPCEGIPLPSLSFLPSLPCVHAAPRASPGPFPMCMGYSLHTRGARGEARGERCMCVLGGRPLLSRSFSFFNFAANNWTSCEPVLTPGQAWCLEWNTGHSLQSLNWLWVLLLQKNSPVPYDETVKRCFKIMLMVCQPSSELLEEKEKEEMGRKRKDMFSWSGHPELLVKWTKKSNTNNGLIEQHVHIPEHFPLLKSVSYFFSLRYACF